MLSNEEILAGELLDLLIDAKETDLKFFNDNNFFNITDEVKLVIDALKSCNLKVQIDEENSNFLDVIIEIPKSKKEFLFNNSRFIIDNAKEYIDEYGKEIFGRYVSFGELRFRNKRYKNESNLIYTPILTHNSNEEREDSNEDIYDNINNKVESNNYDTIEVTYIKEACECAKRRNILAATTMLGCAAERLLHLLCLSYKKYLENNVSEKETNKFINEVVNAQKTHKKLNGFEIKVRDKKELFEKLGFENHSINFSFFDVIRQVRNEAGHPTGKILSDEELKSYFVSYDLLYNRVHKLRQNLEVYKEN